MEEKAQQVQLMSVIYQGAIHVLVCLGEGPLFLALMLLRELRGVRKMFGSFGELMLIQHVGGYLPRQQTDMLLRARIKASVNLLQHPSGKKATEELVLNIHKSNS